MLISRIIISAIYITRMLAKVGRAVAAFNYIVTYLIFVEVICQATGPSDLVGRARALVRYRP